MPRKPRVFTESGLYHVIVRGNNRQNLFHVPEDFETYLNLIQKMKSDYPFHLYHYCLMTNHAHFCFKFMSEEALRKVMQRVNITYAKRFKKRYSYVGHVFQDRFKSFPIEEESYLLECGRYIERNPLKAGMVHHLKDYLWSSYPYYAYAKSDPFITENPLYQNLGADLEERQLRYREYLEVNRPYENFIVEGLHDPLT